MNRVFFIPKVSESVFLEKSLSLNRIILRIGAVFAIISHLLYMPYLILYAKDVLSVMDHRIYLLFYLFYFFYAVIFLILDVGFSLTPKFRNYFYMVSGSIFLFWHTIYNIFNVLHLNVVGNFTIILATFVVAALFVMRPIYILSNLFISYIIVISFLFYYFTLDEVVKYSIVFFLCIIIYFVRYKHLCTEISHKNTLDLIRKKESSISFEWDIQEDLIQFSEEWNDYFRCPRIIENFTQYIKDSAPLTDKTRKILLTCIDNIKSGLDYQKYEFVLPTKYGEDAWFEMYVVGQKDEMNKPAFGIGLLSDITDRKEKIFRLEKELQLDAYTGLLNKTAVEQYGERKLAQLREGELLAALILDVDNFKYINDNYGHPTGDYVLKEIAMILRQRPLKGARIGRMGGDEFVILYCSDRLDDFKQFAYDLMEQIVEFKWDKLDISVSCSIGVAAVYSSKATYYELYRKADDALYQAKRIGKNQIHFNL